LSDRLHQQSVEQKAAARQASQWGGQSVERLIALIAMLLDPSLDLLETTVDSLAGLAEALRGEPPVYPQIRLV
jgi:hypothetical protein